MYLMGFPLHWMACGVPDSATWIVHDCTLGSAAFFCLKQMQHCPSQAPTVSPSKVLHDMAGNSMCIRVVIALLAAALGATRPEMMANI